jgi:hypothetical protein
MFLYNLSHYLSTSVYGIRYPYIQSMPSDSIVWYLNGYMEGMLFNTTFNNISIILWRSVILVEETGVPGENRRHATSH